PLPSLVTKRCPVEPTRRFVGRVATMAWRPAGTTMRPFGKTAVPSPRGPDGSVSAGARKNEGVTCVVAVGDGEGVAVGAAVLVAVSVAVGGALAVGVSV